jgi:gamma-glutamylputrescine oxidase
MFSYWEHKTWLEDIDFCVIGSGIVGLSAALHLRRLQPNARIVVIERATLPNGASTKNAGFACFGSLSELASDCEHTPYPDVVNLVEKRYTGLQLLRSELGDEAIELELLGGYEIFREQDAASYERACALLPAFNASLSDFISGGPVYSEVSNQIKDAGFKEVKWMLFNRAEGQINTGKMMEAFIRKAQATPTVILFGLRVNEIIDEGNAAVIKTEAGQLKARRVIIATNGFASQLLPELDVKPARAQVLVTSEIENLPFKGTFHFDEGYYYFRNVGRRVLLGGGRNLDFEGETTTSHTLTPYIQQNLEQMLHDVILPGKHFSIDYRWAGTMGLGTEKKPIVKQVSPSVYCAVRMGGMGVALGTAVGQEVADLAFE